jgi:hypothetical protein
MNNQDEVTRVEREGRRDFLRKSAYVAPAILTIQAYSAAAKAGSADTCDPPPPPPPKKRPGR